MFLRSVLKRCKDIRACVCVCVYIYITYVMVEYVILICVVHRPLISIRYFLYIHSSFLACFLSFDLYFLYFLPIRHTSAVAILKARKLLCSEIQTYQRPWHTHTHTHTHKHIFPDFQWSCSSTHSSFTLSSLNKAKTVPVFSFVD